MGLLNAVSKLLPAKSSKAPKSPGTIGYASNVLKSGLSSTVGRSVKNTVAAVRADPGGAVAFVSAGTIPALDKASVIIANTAKGAYSTLAGASLKTKVVAGLAAPVGAAILSNEKSAAVIKNYVPKSYEFTNEAIDTFAGEGSFKDLATKYPGFTVAATGAALFGIAGKAAPLLYSAINNDAIRDQTKAIKDQTDAYLSGGGNPYTGNPPALDAPPAPPVPPKDEKPPKVGEPAEPPVTGPTFSPAPTPVPAGAPAVASAPATTKNSVRQNNYFAISNQNVRIEKYKYKRSHNSRNGDRE